VQHDAADDPQPAHRPVSGEHGDGVADPLAEASQGGRAKGDLVWPQRLAALDHRRG
jgi:hypothetical protein